MIAIVSSNARERVALAALCGSRNWPVIECDSFHLCAQLLKRHSVYVVLTRHRLLDGFSDDILAELKSAHPSHSKVIVLMDAGSASVAEARQLALGADCVLRDPVRTNVLVEYLAKYHVTPATARTSTRALAAEKLSFAGGIVNTLERTLAHRKRVTTLTPREVQLVQLLVNAKGGVVSYDTLYSDILDQRFYGQTSNMRVLLGKLTASAKAVGLGVRRWIEVIPKTGYRYTRPV